MRLASRPFLLDESKPVAETPRPNLFASLNPWRVDDDSTGTYVAGDGTRVDPLAPKSGDELFAVADSVFLRSETTQVVPGNEGETTRPGAEFADFDLLADESDHATDFKWDPPEKSDWDELTDASSQLDGHLHKTADAVLVELGERVVLKNTGLIIILQELA